MNFWLIAATLLVLGMIPCGIACLRGSLTFRLPALQLAGVLAALAIMLLSQAYGQPSFFDLALTLIILAFPGGIVFIRFIERWL